MNTLHRRSPRPWALIALFTVLGCSPALAAKPTSLDAKQRYQRESAACAAIHSHGERANCLSEASTRYAGTQPLPAEEQPEVLARNALQRCNALPEVQRKDCVSRMQGQGTVSGSVESGGIYRELVTREVVNEPTR